VFAVIVRITSSLPSQIDAGGRVTVIVPARLQISDLVATPTVWVDAVSVTVSVFRPSVLFSYTTGTVDCALTSSRSPVQFLMTTREEPLELVMLISVEPPVFPLKSQPSTIRVDASAPPNVIGCPGRFLNVHPLIVATRLDASTPCIVVDWS
jgi:hypothetical protein